MDDQKALEQAMEYDIASRDSERWSDFVERSQRGGDYYAGLQTFDEKTKARLKREGKPWIVINQILPINNNLSSTERANRKDAKIDKGRGGYDGVARLMTELDKHTMYLCNGDFVKSDVFLNGVRNVAGWFKIEISYDREPVTGQIVLRSRPSLAVRPDPCCTGDDVNDPKSGCQYIIDNEWISKRLLKSQYPDLSEEIDQAVEDYIGSEKKSIVQRMVEWVTKTEIISDEADEVLFDKKLMNLWRCRVSETWFREYVSRTMVCDRRNWETWWLDPTKPQDRKRIEAIRLYANEYPQIYEIKEKASMPLLHVVRRVGSLLLEHVEDPFSGMMMFPLVPFSPFGDTQYDMGMNDNLIGPQDEINKRLTNATHILNQTANGGMKVGKLATGYGDVLRDFGSSNNFIVELDKCGGVFEKIQPNMVSPGHIALTGLERNYLEEVSGVTGSVRGYENDKNESGRLYNARVKQALTTNQLIFDRFDRACQTVHFVMMEITRRTNTYTEEEIYQIIDEKELIDEDMLNEARAQVARQAPPPAPPDEGLLMQLHPDNKAMVQKQFMAQAQQYRAMADQQAMRIARETLMEQYKASRTGMYNVVVVQSPNAQTTQMANFAELESMIPILPPQIIAPALIQTCGLPKTMKDEILKKLEQFAMTAAVGPDVPATQIPTR